MWLQLYEPYQGSKIRELTAHQRKVWQTLYERYEAHDYQGIVNFKVEASEVAADVRKSHRSLSAKLYALLGVCHRQVKDYQVAIGLFNTAITIYEDIRKDELAANRKTDDRQNLCHACSSLATCYRSTGSFQKALVLYDRALVIGGEADDRQALGRVMRDLGKLYALLGQQDKAIGQLEQASAIANEVGDRRGQGQSCASLAVCHQAMGQYEKAIALGEQSAVIFEDLGDLLNLLDSVKQLGECFTLLGNYARGRFVLNS
jgi:tetratricopeptide (TPR) repeat protein